MAQTAQPLQDVISINFARGQQTFIIPLTFANILDARTIIERIGYGGDIWEVRVDLLSLNVEGPGDENIPPTSYVKEQLQELRAMSSLPILFTIRTKSRGGKFPDAASTEAFELILSAIESSIDYIDVEIEWPEEMIRTITEKKGSTKVVASYHNWTGRVAWKSPELMGKFAAAKAFGGMSRSGFVPIG